MDSAIPCKVCSDHGHKSSKCPQLYDALKEGFFSGGGSGGGGHSHDDDDGEHTMPPQAHINLRPNVSL